MASTHHILDGIPASLRDELTEILVSHGQVRIERIVSEGHSSPDTGWYDQDENEWVMVLQGSAVLTLEENNQRVEMQTGDHILLPTHCRHKVSWTSSDPQCVWLAVFYP